MRRLSKTIRLGIIAAAVLGAATPALAVETITLSGPSGTFGNDAVGLAGSPTAGFTNTFNFLTPAGYTLANGTLSTSAQPTSNVDFTSAFLNGNPFSFTPTGTFEFGTLGNTALNVGGNNVLTVAGNNTGDGAYSGTLTFAAVSSVPEPASWGLMLFGFGAMGFSLRRRRRSAPSLMQAA